jgi:hypothetical protein
MLESVDPHVKAADEVGVVTSLADELPNLCTRRAELSSQGRGRL